MILNILFELYKLQGFIINSFNNLSNKHEAFILMTILIKEKINTVNFKRL